MPALIERVDVGDDAIRIALSLSGLGDLLGCPIEDERSLTLRSGLPHPQWQEVKLVVTDETQAERDEAVVSLLREAFTVRDEVLAAHERTISESATAAGRCRKRLGQLLRLSWLAPDIVDAILEERHARA